MNWREVKRPRLTTVVGAGIGLLGCVLLGRFLIPLVHGAFRDGARNLFDPIGVLFLLTFGTMMILPGACAAYFGFMLVREKSAKSIRRASGSLALIAALFFMVKLDTMWPGASGKLSPVDLHLLLGTLGGTVFYALLAAFLMRSEGIKVTGPGMLVDRGLVFIISLEIFAVGLGITQRYAPSLEGVAEKPGGLWGLFGILVSACVAWLFHRVALKVLRIEPHGTHFTLRDSDAPEKP